MLRLALAFLVVALVAALFGFGMVADLSFEAAKVLFFIFLVLAVLSVLLVEDHPMNRKLFRDILEIQFQVVEAGSAEEALEQLAGVTPDLILLDMQLPGMDGLSLARLLKGDPERASIPIVGLSA